MDECSFGRKRWNMGREGGKSTTGGELRVTAGRWSPRYHLHGFRPASIRHYSSRNARHNLENRAPGAPRAAIFSARDTTAIWWSAPLGVVYQHGHHRIRISENYLPSTRCCYLVRTQTTSNLYIIYLFVHLFRSGPPPPKQ